jgi:tetratricopeptide (TPR) repeat protein
VIAQQYLNKGDVDKSLEYFNKLPENLWNSRTIPIIARAYYSKKDYERVVELLEKETVIKDYSVLVLLANSFMELNRKQRAADYFEILRKYGDTAQINKILGDIYFSLGEKEKAEVYWERAKKLEKSKKEKFE